MKCLKTEILINGWRTEDYLLLPGCAYNGNRFKSVKRKYSPMYEPGEYSEGIIITDIPRLDLDSHGRIEVTTGDMAFPAVGVYLRSQHKGMLISFQQGENGKNYGVTFEETGHGAKVTLSCPESREKIYRHMKLMEREEGACVFETESGGIAYDMTTFECDSVSGLMKEFFFLRDKASMNRTIKNTMAFSYGYKLIEDKYNQLNYQSDTKMYTVGIGESRYAYWQPGWVGGGMASLPLIEFGGDETVRRALETLDYLFKYQSGYGLFYGVVQKDEIYGDGFDYDGTDNFNLIRKDGDALYFAVKHFCLLRKAGKPVKAAWEKGAASCADALVDIFERYGEWGQFVDVETGEIIVGGTSCGGIIPAALALCHQYYGNEKYLTAAIKGAELFYKRDVTNGWTTGGPGEILGCPDSESAFAILESLVALYEATGSGKWLAYAENTAYLCSTWCVGYSFVFPEASEFGRLKIDSLGSVFANVQNKHSAPGICTLSGNSLFKLYRYTANPAYLRLIRQISRFIVQCISSDERPLYAIGGERLPSGYICERVNMSDWEGDAMVGGLFAGSCWPEVSHMLTYLEIPGVYFRKDTGDLCVFDHVDVTVDNGALIIRNPFRYTINVRVMIETGEEINRLSGACYFEKIMNITIGPNEKKAVG